MSNLLSESMRFIGLTVDDLERLRRIEPNLAPCYREMADQFYDSLLAHPRALKVFSGPAQIQSLKGTLQRWMRELLTENRDENYLAKRLEIGRVHVRIAVDPAFIIGAMARVRVFMISRMRGLPGMDSEDLLAFERAVDVDLILISESYHQTTLLQELDRANTSLRHVLEEAPVAVFGYDATGVVTIWNFAAEQLYGYSREEAVGRSLFDLIILEKDRTFVRGVIGRVFEGAAVRPMDRTQHDREGRVIKTIIAHAPRRQAGGITEAFAFCLDVTQLKLIEEKMIEQEKMAGLGTFAAGLAHEVGNPLASISAICQLIERKGDDGRLADRIRTIRDALDRIDSIVRRVLNFARRETDIGPVDVKRVVDETLDLIKFDRRFKEIEIRRSIPSDFPSVLAPHQGLAQVVINLLLNASDAASSRQGVRWIELTGMVKEKGVELLVDDSGPGFSEEVRRRALDPFFSTKPTGSGLGLSISYGILERAGGSMTIENHDRNGGGGRIRLWMPAVD